jgi:hypothetical protein
MMMLLQGSRVAPYRIGSDGTLLLLIVVHGRHVRKGRRSDLGRVSRSGRKVGRALLALEAKRSISCCRSRFGRIDD